MKVEGKGWEEGEGRKGRRIIRKEEGKGEGRKGRREGRKDGKLLEAR